MPTLPCCFRFARAAVLPWMRRGSGVGSAPARPCRTFDRRGATSMRPFLRPGDWSAPDPIPTGRTSAGGTFGRRLARALLGLAALVGLGGLGLAVRPAPLPLGVGAGLPLNSVPLPVGLPEPVDRFYRRLFGGDRVPVVTSAVIVGRGWLRLFGLCWPLRFRFVHEAGRAFRSQIEATAFGLPVMKVEESLADGRGEMRTPFGGAPPDARIDQGSVLRLWAETAMWLPSVLVTSVRVRWLPVDDTTALLQVPTASEVGFETFVARFDPTTGLLRLLEAMRYRGTEQSKSLWLCEARAWAAVSGQTVARTGTLTWEDQGRPWSSFTVEEIVYNASTA